MGQSCTNSLLSCADCNITTTDEVLAEPSNMLNSSIQNFYLVHESKEPVIKCVENIEERISLYEKEIRETKAEILRDKFRAGEQERFLSPSKTRIISSNFSENSLNLIEKIWKTSETDKSFSSVTN